MIRDVHRGSLFFAITDPDPGVKKAPDSGQCCGTGTVGTVTF
jgi:hypothetical protein